MNCPSCGASVEHDATSCPSCGTALTSPSAVNAPPAGSSFEIPKYPGPSASVNEPSPTYAPPGQSMGNMNWQNVQAGTAHLSPFGGVYSGWWRRVGAMIIDSLILGIVLRILTAIVNPHAKDGITDILVVVSIVAQGVYFTRLNGLRLGQTIGNKATGICIRDMATGEPLGLNRSFVRWAIRTALYAIFLVTGLIVHKYPFWLIVPGLLNDLFPLWDANNQTLADKVAKSVVVRL